jgi:16S rRNA (cytosine967-C5)-methyltransferase
MWAAMTDQTRREPQTAPQAAGVAARAAALRLLDAVLRKGLPLESALDSAARGLERTDDRALAHALAAEVLRRLTDLDALIDSATAKPLPPDAKARFALRIALVQALKLGTPAHAAISTVLPLVDGGPRKLVHGVFGTLNRNGARLPELPSLPEGVAERWEAAWGEAVVVAAQHAIAAPPPLDLTLCDPQGNGAELLNGISLAPGHVRLPAGGHIPELPGFAEGDWWVQDISASLPARLIGAGPGRALDLCAAPGGKTTHLAALVGAAGSVVAVERHPGRADALRETCRRLHVEQLVTVETADAAQPRDDAPYDAVLVDPPCSGLGTLQGRPDLRWRASAEAIDELAELQWRILAAGAGALRPGGTLLYVTCTISPGENERVVQRFLAGEAGSDFELEDLGAQLPGLRSRLEPRTLQLLPHRDGTDGFFFARLRRLV